MGIGKNLRKLRDSRSLSQQEVADFIGVERKTYMNWETEVSKVKDTYIPMLADFFKVDINDLFKDNSSSIVITQNNTNKDNKENSVNGIIVLLNDKEAVDEIVKIIKRRQDDSQKG